MKKNNVKIFYEAPAILNRMIFFIIQFFSLPVFEIMRTSTWPVYRDRHVLKIDQVWVEVEGGKIADKFEMWFLETYIHMLWNERLFCLLVMQQKLDPEGPGPALIRTKYDFQSVKWKSSIGKYMKDRHTENARSAIWLCSAIRKKLYYIHLLPWKHDDKI